MSFFGKRTLIGRFKPIGLASLREVKQLICKSDHPTNESKCLHDTLRRLCCLKVSGAIMLV